MNPLHPLKGRKQKQIERSVANASDVVASTIFDTRREQEATVFPAIAIGKKPEMIGTKSYEARVGLEAMRKLAAFGIRDIVFDPDLTDRASRKNHVGYGNQELDYDRSKLEIVMARIPDNVHYIGARASGAVLKSVVQLAPLAQAS